MQASVMDSGSSCFLGQKLSRPNARGFTPGRSTTAASSDLWIEREELRLSAALDVVDDPLIILLLSPRFCCPDSACTRQLGWMISEGKLPKDMEYAVDRMNEVGSVFSHIYALEVTVGHRCVQILAWVLPALARRPFDSREM